MPKKNKTRIRNPFKCNFNIKYNLQIEDLFFINRIYYKAYSDAIWGEHESILIYYIFIVDYVFFIKADVEMKVNNNEVQATKYVNIEELKHMIKKSKYSFKTFKMVIKRLLLGFC